MTIRPATPEDVPRVLPMVEKICAFHEALVPLKYGFLSNIAQMYGGWLVQRANDAKSVFLVAEADHGLAGFLIATTEREIPIYRITRFGFIHDVWVEPEYRNEGIARQLVTLALERFAALGVEQIRLDTAAANEPARKLFASCGFRASTTEMLLPLNDGAKIE